MRYAFVSAALFFGACAAENPSSVFADYRPASADAGGVAQCEPCVCEITRSDLCAPKIDIEPVADDVVLLTDPASEPACWFAYNETFYDVQESSPLNFWIYGPPQREYCITIVRWEGYITLSHETGDVSRDGDLFSFCGEPIAWDAPLVLTVRSLTPTARFSLQLERR